MNSVYIWGTPNDCEEGAYVALTRNLIQIFKSEGLEPVVVFFPPDRMRWELGKEMVVHISGPRIPDGEMKQKLAKSVGTAVYETFEPDHIDCIVLRDEPWPGAGRWFNP